MLATSARCHAEEVVGLLTGAAMFGEQNWLTHGKPFPIVGYRSFARLPVCSGGEEYPRSCDDWNENIASRASRVPELYGTATGSRGEQTS